MFGLDNLMDLLFDSAMESINRNERVIQLLKRLNLDPDHPPADFVGVYQYALVEYGVGKPRPALEIFRQTKIQELFREALERNNPSILLKNGEGFLADSPLQADLQASNVDVRREFYAFAAVFIEVAKRTRTPAEILAEQKLESLHRQIGSLQERLNRLPTIEGLRTEMARLAAPSYPALPGSESFSAEQCKAFALAQQMRGWFETLGFDLESHEVWQDDYFEWIINIPVRRGRYDRILVRGIDGEAGLSAVEDLKQSVATHRTDEGWLVTARRISRAARDEVEKTENEGLGCYTLDELLDQDADFSGYLTWLEAEIQKRGIDQKYVPLACLKEEIDPDTQQRIGVSRYDDRDGWIDGYIDLWLDDPAKEHISVLGEFGTGKTWFALHYAWKALQRYREAQRRGLERPRLPLVIPLRDYAKAVSVESLFSEFFFRKHEIPIPGYSAFEQLNRMGKLLLIFDGFDEMAARVDRQEMINNFWELAKVVVPGAKVILTCRTEHFPEAKEGRALLNAELQASTRDLTGETPQFEVLELEKFNDEQIRRVLEHQAQPATVEQIMGNPQLLDLARRPVLTELILEALPDIEAGKPVDMSRVYLYAVRHKMERDIKAERTFTSMADKLYFMCELSWEMLSTDRMSINYREFPDRIRKLFGPAVQEEKDLDHWHYDMMGQTMLIRNAEGDYAPAHRSLLEFFVAIKFASELGILAEDFLELAKIQANLPDQAKPESYTWSAYFNDERGNRLNNKAFPMLKSFRHEDLDKLRASVGQRPFTKAILDLLLPIVRDPLSFSNEVLIEVIKLSKGETEQSAGYIGGNTITLLSKINNGSITNIDLAETILCEADLTDTKLHNVNLSKADLRGVHFSKALGDVTALRFSSDGNMLAVGDRFGMIYILAMPEKYEIITCKAHSSWIHSLALNVDAKLLITASNDQRVKIWNVNTGECLKSIKEGHSIHSVSISKHQPIFAYGGRDNSIKIRNIVTGECLQTLLGHTAWVEVVLFGEEDNSLISAGGDKSIRIWDITTGSCIKELTGHTGKIYSIALSPDGKILASGSTDNTIRLWCISTWECIQILVGHRRRIRALTFSSDGQYLVSGSDDTSIKIWEIYSGKCIRTLNAHQGWIRALDTNKSKGLFASGSSDKSIVFWDLRNYQYLNKFQGYTSWIRSITFSYCGQILASGGDDKAVTLWDTASGNQIKTLKGHTAWVHSITFCPGGNLLATASDDKSIKIWNIATGRCIKTLKGHDGWLHSVAVSPSGEILASGGDDLKIILWHVKSGDILRVLEGHTNPINSIDFSPDGERLISGSSDNTLIIWDLKTYSFKTLEGHQGLVRTVCFNHSGKLIASAGSDESIRIWDSETCECIKNLRELNSFQWSVEFSPNDKLLASGGFDENLRIWDVETGELLFSLEGRFCTFSPDGTLLASCTKHDTIKFWDTNTWDCVRTINNLPYRDTNIYNARGLGEIAKNNLFELGAIEKKVLPDEIGGDY